MAHPDSPELTREEPRALAVARAAAAMACLLVQLRFSSGSQRLVTGAIALFVVYALAVLVFRRKGRAGWGLLALVGDTVFFLFFAGFGADPGAWASSAFYSYLLLSSFLLHPWWDTLAIAWASCIYVVAVRAADEIFLSRVVLWGGIVASLASWYRSKLEDRLAAATKLIQSQAELIARARDDERNKLAGDFHDGPLQGFIGMGMRLEVLRKMLERNPKSVLQELLELQDLSRSQIAEMRAFLRGIRPLEAGGGGLIAAGAILLALPLLGAFGLHMDASWYLVIAAMAAAITINVPMMIFFMTTSLRSSFVRTDMPLVVQHHRC